MKADIITMHMINNYGSVLQTYASCEMFSKLHIEPEIIDYYPERLNGYGSFLQLYRDAKPFHKNTLKCIIVALVNWPSYKLQNKVFQPFVRKYIPMSKRYNSIKELRADPPKADIYCTGSDQVWNNYLDSKRQFDEAYFLKFVSCRDAKRIAYSASFGRSDFDEKELAQIGKLLQGYDFISVREQSGLNVMENAKVKNGCCCLDPTFMVDRKTWNNLAEPISDKDYILVYKLHEDSIASEVAVELGRLMNKKVIRISTALHRRIKGGKIIMLPTVGQFISYIMNASMVVTDSFHATALSVNFNVPFFTVRWKMFNDRAESILNKVGLSDRLIGNVEEATNANFTIDFTQANEKLEMERKECIMAFESAVLG